MFQRIAVAGFGLIGGSVALALRTIAPRCQIVAIDDAAVVSQVHANTSDARVSIQRHDLMLMVVAHEVFGPTQALGMALVLGGVLLGQRRSSARSAVPVEAPTPSQAEKIAA